MSDKSELNDILLDRSSAKTSRKKILVILAILALMLIGIVMIVGMLSQSQTAGIPQHKTVLVANSDNSYKQDRVQDLDGVDEDAIESEISAIIEKVKAQERAIADAKEQHEESLQSKKEESIQRVFESVKPTVEDVPKQKIDQAPQVKQVTQLKRTNPTVAKERSYEASKHYIQVGSFSKYSPDKKFLKNITDNGFSYSIHRVVTHGKIANRLLIGPFDSKSDAKASLKKVKRTIESGAFIYSK